MSDVRFNGDPRSYHSLLYASATSAAAFAGRRSARVLTSFAIAAHSFSERNSRPHRLLGPFERRRGAVVPQTLQVRMAPGSARQGPRLRRAWFLRLGLRGRRLPYRGHDPRHDHHRRQRSHYRKTIAHFGLLDLTAVPATTPNPERPSILPLAVRIGAPIRSAGRPRTDKKAARVGRFGPENPESPADQQVARGDAREGMSGRQAAILSDDSIRSTAAMIKRCRRASADLHRPSYRRIRLRWDERRATAWPSFGPSRTSRAQTIRRAVMSTTVIVITLNGQALGIIPGRVLQVADTSRFAPTDAFSRPSASGLSVQFWSAATIPVQRVKVPPLGTHEDLARAEAGTGLASCERRARTRRRVRSRPDCSRRQGRCTLRPPSLS